MDEQKQISLLNKRIDREKRARKEAEEILEKKALELYQANQQLLKLNENLEKEIHKRTDDLAKSRMRYEQLVESATEIIYEVDYLGNVLYANPVTEKLLGFPEREMLQKNVIDLIADSHKSYITEEFWAGIKQGQEQFYHEFPCVKKNGETIWLGQNFQNQYTLIDGKKIFKGGRGIARDITQNVLISQKLERSEEKYRSIIENMDLGYLEVDNDGRIVRAYDRFCSMTGYSESELIGKIADDILVPEKYRKKMQKQDASRQKGVVSTYEIQILKKNGDLLWVLISGGPVYGDNGECIGSVGIHYDLSEQKRVQEELAQAKKVAEDAQKAEQGFLANMSHEIRTPLNAIIGMSHLLYDTKPTEEQKDYFDIINNSANFLHTLISDVLDMAKIEAGHINPKKEPFDLLGVIYTLQRTFELKASSKKDLAILCEVDPKLEHLVKGDETLLNQVLLNIVGNAEKFTEEGEIKIEVKIKSKIEDELNIEFKISDTGIGMPKEKLKLIFQKFKQIEEESKTKTKGTGLGLAIVKELIDRMGGVIEVDSEPGKGSVFTFVLPFGYTEIKRKKNIELIDTTSSEFQGRSILIVEDNMLNLKYAGKLLEKWGINQTHALDGLQAVEKANAQHFDLILMDIQMPNMNGYEAAIQIRNTINVNRVTPIVALTASAMVNEKHKAVNAGMNGVLTKPFRPGELKQVLDQYFGEITTAKSKETNNKNAILNIPAEMKIDKSKLTELYGDDMDFKTMVFETFLEEIPSQVEDFTKNFKAKEWDEVAKVAHKMKPSLGMVGLPDVEEMLRIIESTIKKDGVNTEVEELSERFLSSFPSYIDLVNEELQSSN